jgi:hypothetical protein
MRGMNHFGFPEGVWAAAKREVIQILSEMARRGATIAYSDLVASLNSIQLEARDIRLFHLLGEVSTDENASGRGMLSVVVVHKDGDMRPGPGFFELAQHLGHEVEDLDRFWIEEFRCVCEYWRNH